MGEYLEALERVNTKLNSLEYEAEKATKDMTMYIKDARKNTPVQKGVALSIAAGMDDRINMIKQMYEQLENAWKDLCEQADYQSKWN